MDQDKRLHRSKPLPMRLSMRSGCPYIIGKTEQRIAVDIEFQLEFYINSDTLFGFSDYIRTTTAHT